MMAHLKLQTTKLNSICVQQNSHKKFLLDI